MGRSQAEGPRSGKGQFTPDEEAERVACIVEHKEACMRRRGRCARCWHLTTSGCICAALAARPLECRRAVRFMLYIHWREYYCAGDDAKLLCCGAPDESELFVFGRRGDDARFVEAIEPALRSSSALLLFPDDEALSVEGFVARRFAVVTDAGDDASTPLVIVVVDAPWTLARKMAHHLDALLGGRLPHVKLETDLVSSYARTQSQTGRVCTVEAIALFLRQVGEPPEVFDTLLAYLRLNNAALLGPERKPDLWRRGPHMGHPAWYFRHLLTGDDPHPAERHHRHEGTVRSSGA